MFKGLTCAECNSKEAKLYEDMRIPPLDVGDCLCAMCADGAVDERIEELQEEIDHLQTKKEALPI